MTVSAVPVSPAVAADFTLSPNRALTVAPGETTSTGLVTITANDNAVDAPDRQVTVTAVAANDHGVTAPGEQTLTIIDDDDAPGSISLRLSETSIDEGAEAAVLTVTAAVEGGVRFGDGADRHGAGRRERRQRRGRYRLRRGPRLPRS